MRASQANRQATRVSHVLERFLSNSDMSDELRQLFARYKPLCSGLAAYPTSETVQRIVACVTSSPRTTQIDTQLFVVFPFIQHIKSEELRKKYEVQTMLIDGLRAVLDMFDISSIDLFLKCYKCLVFFMFDKRNTSTGKPTVAQVPEELKLAVMEALNTLHLRLTDELRLQVYDTQYMSLMAQSVYLGVHVAKLEKLRSLKLAAITCVLSITGTHPDFLDDNYQHKDPQLVTVVADVVSGILPGIIGGLQDLAVSGENQGHIVTARAVNAIHRIICLVMNDRDTQTPHDVTNADFSRLITKLDGQLQLDNEKNSSPTTNHIAHVRLHTDLIRNAIAVEHAEISETTTLGKRSPQYYLMAGRKLRLVTKSLMTLQNHEHFKVRKELAVYCSRILLECPRTMAPSLPYVLDLLIALSEDEYTEVSEQCINTLHTYFQDSTRETRDQILNDLADNFYYVLSTVPRVMNNIDNRKKECALQLLRGQIALLSDASLNKSKANLNLDGPDKLTQLLSCSHTLGTLCGALVETVRLDSSAVSLLLEASVGDMEAPVRESSPWCKLVHLDDKRCAERVQRVCRQLGGARCADLVVDRLLELFREATDSCEVVYLLNYVSEGEQVNVDRILSTYIEPEVWYLPLEVGSQDAPISALETRDVSVYNPRAWDKESVPDLYEGTVETRYTDVSLHESRAVRSGDPDRCRTLREARDNMVLSCLLTEGVGIAARKLRENFQPYLLRTLCLLLERVGSKYEMLRCAGMKALRDVTLACGHADVAQLVRSNADYFTYQVTRRLKKEWNCVSALHMLAVVLQHSDASILNCLHGLIHDVLLQSCDRYHQSDVTAYLQVFLTFITRVRKWFPKTPKDAVRSIQNNVVRTPKNDSKVSKKDAQTSKSNTPIPNNDTQIPNNDLEMSTNNAQRTVNDAQIPNIDAHIPKNDAQTCTNDIQIPNNDIQMPNNDKHMPNNVAPTSNSDSDIDKCDIEDRLSDLLINSEYDILTDTLEYIKNFQEPERLLEQDEFEKEMGQTTEEMFQEDLRKKEEDEDVDYSSDAKEKTEIPQHVVMVSSILKRSMHHVPSHDRNEKCLALQLLEQGLPVLEGYEDELLPVCHLLWSPLVVRFSEVKQPVVLLRAFQLLATMAQVAKDFMRNRTVKEVLPFVCKFLIKSSEDSLLKDAGSVYRVSQAYRLQLAMLERLGDLATDLGLSGKQLEDILAATSLYLSNKQPKPLQAAAVQLFKKIFVFDEGVAWHHLRLLSGNQILTEPPALACNNLTLEPVIGIPLHPTDKCYKNNINAIFNVH